MIRGVNLNHPNNHSIKVTSLWTNDMFPGGKSNPATIASIGQNKISHQVAARSFLEAQQHTTAVCWQTQQSITTAKVVILAGASIVCGDNANDWNNPFWRRERCKHLFAGQDNTVQYIIQYVSPPKKAR